MRVRKFRSIFETKNYDSQFAAVKVDDTGFEPVTFTL